MAARSGEVDGSREVDLNKYVADFFNENFGEDLDRLQNLCKIIEDQEKLKAVLETKVIL